MQYVIATSNEGKVKEIRQLCQDMDVVPYSKLIDEFDIEETGSTFKENALIKARAVYEKLCNKDVIVLADDSGISVDVLDGRPGIYSARFAGIDASDADNRAKMIEELKSRGIKKTPAFYTAAIAVVSAKGEFTAHGYCYGNVIDEQRGKNGFGYDFMFIPEGYDKTLGELSPEIKQSVSHRVKALNLIKKVL